MKKIKTFSELLENKRLPKDLYLKLKRISNGVSEYIAGAKAEEVFNNLDTEDFNDLIMNYWDESVDFSTENIEKVRELIGNIEDIKPYW